ncbi:uncharacterized protein LOC131228877 [Magnolia sinica]|uniref:uncharacterized protein LOC131228877 n=1 Tax=Magnolia sinica TaxID=86752 RepID=UPI00265AFA08|nr:uncharacterized protein LOC131228877 [Magnolia sinica]
MTRRRASSRRRARSSDDARRRQIPDPKCLFVGNLPFSCSTEDMLKIFQKYGRIAEVFLPFFPSTSKPRGYGFVRFFYEDDARAAMGVLDGQRIDGRQLFVKNARPKPTQRPKSSHSLLFFKQKEQGNYRRLSEGSSRGSRHPLMERVASFDGSSHRRTRSEFQKPASDFKELRRRPSSQLKIQDSRFQIHN